MPDSPSNNTANQEICLACGLCCNGVIFRDVELQPGDDAARLEMLGLRLERLRAKTRLPQPCPALGPDCRCRIYADRPARCRQFDCALLKSVLAGRTTMESALCTITQTRQRADKVRRLLRELNDTDEHIALSIRFRRLKKRLETKIPDEESADFFGELSLAVHDLNLLLRRAFLPDQED